MPLIKVCGVVAIVLIPFIIILLAIREARNKKRATFVPRNHYEIVVAGENPIAVLCLPENNLWYDTARDQWRELPLCLTESARRRLYRQQLGNNPFSRWLAERWGFFWVSWFYPIRQLLEEDVDRERLFGQTQVRPGAGIIQMIEKESPITVKSFRRDLPRPVAIINAETKNRLVVSMVVNVVIRVTKPILWTTTWNLDFNLVVIQLVQGAVNDVVRTLNTDEVIKLKKSKSADSSRDKKTRDFSAQVIKILNDGGIEERFGVTIVDVWVKELQLDESAQQVLTARAKQLEQAMADRDQAKIDLETSQLKAQGEVAIAEQLSRVLATAGGNAPAIAGILKAKEMKNLTGNVTYVEAGVSGVQPTLPITTPSAPVPAPTTGS